MNKIENIKEVAKELHNENVDFFVDLAKKLSQKSSVEVVFSGTLSNGKSTLINAILGKNLLQTGVGSTTAKITYISYGDEDCVCSYKADNLLVKYPLNSENIKNSTKIKRLLILR